MPATALRRLWAGDGARRLVCPLAKPERGDWLLARRSVADPTETASFVCFGPATTSLTELVRGGDAVDERSLFRGGQGEVGLDPDEVRRWDGGYRHLTRCLVAHAFLMAMREHAGASHGTPRRMPPRLAAACPPLGRGAGSGPVEHGQGQAPGVWADLAGSRQQGACSPGRTGGASANRRRSSATTSAVPLDQPISNCSVSRSCLGHRAAGGQPRMPPPSRSPLPRRTFRLCSHGSSFGCPCWPKPRHQRLTPFGTGTYQHECGHVS